MKKATFFGLGTPYSRFMSGLVSLALLTAPLAGMPSTAAADELSGLPECGSIEGLQASNEAAINMYYQQSADDEMLSQLTTERECKHAGKKKLQLFGYKVENNNLVGKIGFYDDATETFQVTYQMTLAEPTAWPAFQACDVLPSTAEADALAISAYNAATALPLQAERACVDTDGLTKIQVIAYGTTNSDALQRLVGFSNLAGDIMSPNKQTLATVREVIDTTVSSEQPVQQVAVTPSCSDRQGFDVKMQYARDRYNSNMQLPESETRMCLDQYGIERTQVLSYYVGRDGSLQQKVITAGVTLDNGQGSSYSNYSNNGSSNYNYRNDTPSTTTAQQDNTGAILIGAVAVAVVVGTVIYFVVKRGKGVKANGGAAVAAETVTVAEREVQIVRDVPRTIRTADIGYSEYVGDIVVAGSIPASYVPVGSRFFGRYVMVYDPLLQQNVLLYVDNSLRNPYFYSWSYYGNNPWAYNPYRASAGYYNRFPVDGQLRRYDAATRTHVAPAPIARAQVLREEVRTVQTAPQPNAASARRAVEPQPVKAGNGWQRTSEVRPATGSQNRAADQSGGLFQAPTHTAPAAPAAPAKAAPVQGFEPRKVQQAPSRPVETPHAAAPQPQVVRQQPTAPAPRVERPAAPVQQAAAQPARVQPAAQPPRVQPVASAPRVAPSAPAASGPVGTRPSTRKF